MERYMAAFLEIAVLRMVKDVQSRLLVLDWAFHEK